MTTVSRRSSSTTRWNGVKRVLMVPRVAVLSARAPRNPTVGWNRYWRDIRTTGSGGEVLWDWAEMEMPDHLITIRQHLDPALPIVDVGCGNGRFTRLLAQEFPRAVGIDGSPDAIARARAESRGLTGLSFSAMDATLPTTGTQLRDELGESNVFVRGVFHVLSPVAQRAAARSLRVLLGKHGRLFLAETNFRGTDLAYLQHLGATPWHIPTPLQLAIVNLPRPGHFGPDERALAFPADNWRVVVDGSTLVYTVPMRGTTEPERIPGYFAVLAPR